MSTKGQPREPLWTESEIDFLRANYTQLRTVEIASRLGRSYESVRRKASKVGVQRQNWGTRFTPEEDALIREKFTISPMSEMVALLGRHHNSIRFRARSLGLENGEQVKRADIASAIRHHYFGQVDTPMKAYLLGLMATDGTVALKTNAISLKVGLKDIELAELARDEISPRSAVRVYTYPPLPGYAKERKVAQFGVSSPQIKADLVELGVVPRKTFIIEWPRLAPEFTAPFMLGCFDGDGHLSCRGKAWTWRWHLYSASEGFLASAREVIRQHVGLDAKKATSKRGLHVIRVNGANSVRIMDEWLHADVSGLARKRLPAGACADAEQATASRLREMGRRRTLSRHSLEDLERARELRSQGLTLRQAADATGISSSVIYRWTTKAVPRAG